MSDTKDGENESGMTEQEQRKAEQEREIETALRELTQCFDKWDAVNKTIAQHFHNEQDNVAGLVKVRNYLDQESSRITHCYKRATTVAIIPSDQEAAFTTISGIVDRLRVAIDSRINALRQETKSKHSGKSNESEKAADAAADAAEKNVALKFMDEETELEGKLKKLRAQKASEMAAAKAQVLNEADKGSRIKDFEETDPKERVKEFVDQLPKDDKQDDGERETTRNTNKGNDVSSLMKVLLDQAYLSRLPVAEPTVFAGDPLKYSDWKASFETLIEGRAVRGVDKLHYFRRYLTGDALSCVEGYFILNTESAFIEAKAVLEKRYGNSFTLANAFRDKLEDWPKVEGKDSAGLRRFSDFLKQCKTAMSTLKCLNVLDDDRENRKLLTKLPDWIVTKWARRVAENKIKTGRFPSFSTFCSFIELESDIANDPVTSLSSIRGKEKKDTPPPKQSTSKKESGGSLAVKGNEQATGGKEKDKEKSSKCLLCDKSHWLDVCPEFLAKTLDGRREFVISNRLCFGCLKKGHISKKCQHRAKCKTCGYSHPTSMHKERFEKNNNVSKGSSVSMAETVNAPVFTPQVVPTTSNFVSNNQVSKSAMIVPVWLSHNSNPSKEVMVYAMLDTQSDMSFIKSSMAESLGVAGTTVKLALSTMLAENKLVDSSRITGMAVRGHDSNERISISSLYTRHIMPANREHIPTAEMTKKWSYLQQISSKLLPIQDCEIGLLLGYDCPRAIAPMEMIPPIGDGPYGQRSVLGWGIIGVIDKTDTVEQNDVIGCSHKVLAVESPCDKTSAVQYVVRKSVKEVVSPKQILEFFEHDFNEGTGEDEEMSQDDRQFLSILNSSIHKTENGHYEMPLPFRDGTPKLTNNEHMARKRLAYLKKKMTLNEGFKNDYVEFMNEIIERGFAEKVDESDQPDNLWYIPHHGVYNPNKPKIRVVFDCSAKYNGVSLNDCLLQGPDLTNSLVGVLCRFRQHKVAFMCDIEKMFYQFYVNEEHRNYLRFFWWENGDLLKEPSVFRMTVHIFGAGSSPGCSNFGLKQTATDNEKEFGTDVAEFIRKNFYVDDGVKSEPSDPQAISMIKRSTAMCKKGGLRLHKFACSSKEVIKEIPTADRAKNIQEIDLARSKLPVERVLGSTWLIESDEFQFKIKLPDRPLTRRGILSVVSSIYDPIGFVSPFTLVGKQILQELCKLKIDWDEKIPDKLERKWLDWRDDVMKLEDMKIARCLKPPDFGEISAVEMHHFSDASSTGYGAVSYIRMFNKQGDCHVCFLMAKARVVSIKHVSIPRLELVAALLGVKLHKFLNRELEYENVSNYFWCDSTSVLGYINNDAKRFRTFVANRVQQIRDQTATHQWRFIAGEDNPSDCASRGLSAIRLVNSTTWLNGPTFLLDVNFKAYVCDSDVHDVRADDPELKSCTVHAMSVSRVIVDESFDVCDRFSNLNRLKRVIAICLKFVRRLQYRVKLSKQEPDCVDVSTDISVDDLRDAEVRVLRIVQAVHFKEEIECLSSYASGEVTDRTERRTLKRTSPLLKLSCFIDSNGLLRVGGRLASADIPDCEKHPIVLPKSSNVTDLVIRYCHENVKHQGKGTTLNEIRCNGFWIVNANSVVSNYVWRCVTCRKLRGQVQEQIMSDLPSDRVDDSPCFTYCGCDCFGPFVIKEGRKECKRYGVIFTCMASRAVHIEVANALSTDAFINALRRFIAIRGSIRMLRCDRGTNFVGARNELNNALSEIDDDVVRAYLQKESCDFKFNVPSASHMGGSWERLIRSVRTILNGMLCDHKAQLDDESLRTFLYECMAIINNRPLTTESLNDPDCARPLTPNHLLTMKCKIVLPPPGNFVDADVYSRKRWRRVQFLSELFWSRFKREYLQCLQTRQKWNKPRRAMCVGDIVLLKDDLVCRNMWQMCKVVETYPSNDGYVRKVKLQLGDSGLVSAVKFLERPIQKVVLLVEAVN